MELLLPGRLNNTTGFFSHFDRPSAGCPVKEPVSEIWSEILVQRKSMGVLPLTVEPGISLLDFLFHMSSFEDLNILILIL